MLYIDVSDSEVQGCKLLSSGGLRGEAIGHGIPNSFLEKIRKVGREFFEQPMEEKKKQAKGVEEFEGYGADPVPAEGQPLDWSDRIFLDVYPEDRRKPKFWPESPASFRKSLKDSHLDDPFHQKFDQLNYMIVANGLSMLLHHMGYATISKYHNFPVSSGIIDFDIQNRVIMTNGVFKSPVHRVLANSERERISVAVFYTPEANKEIGPEDGLIDEERPKLFKKAIGHGISSSFLDKIRQVAREFFEQPMEEKKKLAKGVGEFEGYGADPIPAEGLPLDWSDRLFLPVFPEDRKNLKFWPENPESFRVLTNSERERMSVAVFFYPEPDKEIGPEDGLVNEERPKLFKKVKGYHTIHLEHYLKGMRAIHTAKV
ncbi:hypothetical protein L1049_004781 [Liquidambar formosana]|uniref:Isopenicillin N synthase-like Fe(2+) 2OG dioxygenase domain-containing protein n=1 Tax=Liquidambar formosana TaxID=63359 RepID=A0AAP0WW09_LIQFO